MPHGILAASDHEGTGIAEVLSASSLLLKLANQSNLLLRSIQCQSLQVLRSLHIQLPMLDHLKVVKRQATDRAAGGTALP